MTKAEILARRLEVRARLLELNASDSLTDEEASAIDALMKENVMLERRAAAVEAAEGIQPPEAGAEADEPGTEVRAADGEEAERLELRSRVELRRWFGAALRGRPVDGAEAEYAVACGVHGGADIPLDVFEAQAEDRTATNAPATVGVNMAPIQPHVFAPSVAGMLGIDMPSVASGTFGQSRISTNLTAGDVQKGSKATATAAGFTTKTTTPRRISARLEFLAEDVATAGVGNFESALRQNLQAVLADALDQAILTGDRDDADWQYGPNGLLNELTPPGGQGALLTFANGLTKTAAHVDGHWASQIGALRLLAGVATYKLAAGLFRGTGTDFSLLDFWSAKLGGVVTNSHMPATASAGAAAKNQLALFFRGGRGLRTAVMPHWGRLSITDVYTGAASALTSVTLHVLVGDVLVIQPSAYVLDEFQVVA